MPRTAREKKERDKKSMRPEKPPDKEGQGTCSHALTSEGEGGVAKDPAAVLVLCRVAAAAAASGDRDCVERRVRGVSWCCCVRTYVVRIC